MKRLFKRIFHRNSLDEDVQEEIESHIAMRTEHNRQSGMSAEDAANTARQQFGSTLAVRETIYEISWLSILDSIFQDLRFGWRGLQSNKAWSVVAVLSLAIGIGANAGVVSMLVPLIEKLPVRNPDELVAFHYGATADSLRMTSQFVFEQMRSANQTLSEMFAFSEQPNNCGPLATVCGRMNLGAHGQWETAGTEYVSGGFFSGLGIAAIRGRTITPEDDVASAPPIAVISYRLWERRFQRASDVVGMAVSLDNQPLTIVGVLPETMRNPIGLNKPMPDVFLPLAHRPAPPEMKFPLVPIFSDFAIMGRRKPGVTLAQVNANFDEVAARALQTQYGAWISTLTAEERGAPEFHQQKRFPQARVVSGSRGVIDLDPRTLRNIEYLATISGILLFIVCMNVTNLLLARAAVHQKEIAVRTALGASRVRLIRQLLVESVLLAVVGAMLSIGMAEWPKLYLAWGLPEGVAPPTLPSAFDPRILTFELILAVLAGLAFGIGPSLRAVQAERRAGIATEVRPFGGCRSRFARALVISQVALSVALLIVAGLFFGATRRLHGTNLGFNPDNVAVFSVNPAQNNYSIARTSGLYQEMLDRIAKLPGVRSASFSDMSFLVDSRKEQPVPVFMKRQDKNPQAAVTERREIHPDFFKTMQIPLQFGRFFTEDDSASAPRVVIVNEAFVRAFLTTPNPTGSVVRWGEWPAALQRGVRNVDRWGDLHAMARASQPKEVDRDAVQQAEIVGVVGDVRTNNLENPVAPMLYTPASQSLLPKATFEIRVAGNVESTLPAIRNAVQLVDPSLPVSSLFNHRAVTDSQLMGDQKLFAQMTQIVAAVALIIAMIGLFSLMSYLVARRTREIGICMAMGAQRRVVRLSIMRQTQALVFAGLIAGIGFALALTTVLEMRLYGLGTHDPKTILLVALLTVMVAGLAGYLPARRASQVDPIAALRHD